MLQYLDIDKTQIPLSMLIVVEEEQYEFVFNYNSLFDFFTVTLIKDEVEIITGEKVLLDKVLFTMLPYPFKNTYFIPMDLSDKADRITFDNFGTSVFIYMFKLDEGGEPINE